MKIPKKTRFLFLQVVESMTKIVAMLHDLFGRKKGFRGLLGNIFERFFAMLVTCKAKNTKLFVKIKKKQLILAFEYGSTKFLFVTF